MGSSFDNWDVVEGAYYMGAGTAWEVVWTLVAIGICIYAMVAGSKHERAAYRRMTGK